MEQYNNPRSTKIKQLLKLFFLSKPLRSTKSFGSKVLDLGCGWGFYFKINPQAHGIDYDKSCVSYLQKLGYKVIFGDITNRLPFSDNSFQWVIGHDILEHFELKDVEKILSEVTRILEPTGKFLIISPNAKGYKLGIKRMVGHKHFINRKEILEKSAKKFSEIDHYYYPFPKIIGNYFSHNKEVIILKKIT